MKGNEREEKRKGRKEKECDAHKVASPSLISSSLLATAAENLTT